MNTYKLRAKHDARKSFYNKAMVIIDDNILKLKSYDTIVAEYDKDKDKMTVNGWYSHTTGRHINEFLRQHGYKKMTKSDIENKEPERVGENA